MYRRKRQKLMEFYLRRAALRKAAQSDPQHPGQAQDQVRTINEAIAAQQSYAGVIPDWRSS